MLFTLSTTPLGLVISENPFKYHFYADDTIDTQLYVHLFLSSDSLVLSIPYCRYVFHPSAKNFSCNRSATPGIHSLPIPKTVLLSQYSVPSSKHTSSNCVSSLGSFSSPLTVYPDYFDSCYSHFMPYRVTPREKNISVIHNV